MSKARPKTIDTRTAAYTCADESEIQLIYPHEGLLDDRDNGKATYVYYDTPRYVEKQAEHGLAVYPKPTRYQL